MDVFMDYWLEVIIFVAGAFEICKFAKKKNNNDGIDLYAGLSLIIGVIYILLGIYFLTPLSEKRDKLTMILGIVWAASVVARWIYGKKKNAA